jgi:hypothetical protein
MILPTKGIQADRALLSIGADILRLLDEPKTISRLWEQVRAARSERPASSTLGFDWFVLALDLLYALGVVDWEHGRLFRLSAPEPARLPERGPSSPVVK